MKLTTILTEASYPGNIGAMEVFQFYKSATDNEKKKFDDLIKHNDYDSAWDLIQDVTGVQLHSMSERYERISDKPTTINISIKDGYIKSFRVLNVRPSDNDNLDYLIKTNKGSRWIHYDRHTDKVYAYTGKNDRQILFLGDFVGVDHDKEVAVG